MTDGHDGTLGIKDIVRILRRHALFLIAFVAVSAALGAAVAFSIEPLYRARAALLLVTEARWLPRTDYNAARPPLAPPDEAALRSQAEVVASPVFALRLTNRLHLDEDPEFNPALDQRSAGGGALLGELQDLVGSTWQTVWTAIRESSPLNRWASLDDPGEEIDARLLQATAGATRPAPQSSLVSDAELPVVRRVQRALGAYIKGDTQVLVIEARSRDPRKAVLLANTAAELYLASSRQAKAERSAPVEQWLDRRLDELRAKVAESERRVEEYRREVGMFEGETSKSILVEQLSQLAREIAEAQAERMQAEAKLEQLERVQGSPQSVEATDAVLLSPLIQSLRAEEGTLVAERGRLRSTHGPKHPLMADINSQIEDLRTAIAREIERLLQAERDRAEVAEVRENMLRTAKEELEQRISEQNSHVVRLAELERDAAANREVYASFLQQSILQRGLGEIETGEFELLAPATPPADTATPDPLLVVGLISVASAFMGMLFAGAREGLDNTFRSADQVARHTGLPTLSLVPLVSSRRLRRHAEDVVVAERHSAAAEAIRYLYAPLALATHNGEESAPAVLVTSAVPAEGKTMIAISLAREAALAGKRTLLIDLDLHQQTNRRFARARNHAGSGAADLIEAISQSHRLDSLIDTEAGSSLLVLTCPRAPIEPVRFLSEAGLAAFLQLARRRFDLIVIDSAPVLSVADARLLAELVDRTILVIRWAKTPRETVIEALKQLKMFSANVSGVVLNQVNPKKHAKYGFGDSGLYVGRHKKYYSARAQHVPSIPAHGWLKHLTSGKTPHGGGDDRGYDD